MPLSFSTEVAFPKVVLNDGGNAFLTAITSAIGVVNTATIAAQTTANTANTLANTLNTYVTDNKLEKAFATQTLSPQVIPAATTWDASNGQVAVVTLDKNILLGIPTSLVAGKWYHLIVIQNSTGNYDITFETIFTDVPKIRKTASAITVLSFIYHGSKLRGPGLIKDLQDADTTTLSSISNMLNTDVDHESRIYTLEHREKPRKIMVLKNRKSVTTLDSSGNSVTGMARCSGPTVGEVSDATAPELSLNSNTNTDPYDPTIGWLPVTGFPSRFADLQVNNILGAKVTHIVTAKGAANTFYTPSAAMHKEVDTPSFTYLAGKDIEVDINLQSDVSNPGNTEVYSYDFTVRAINTDLSLAPRVLTTSPFSQKYVTTAGLIFDSITFKLADRLLTPVKHFDPASSDTFTAVIELVSIDTVNGSGKWKILEKTYSTVVDTIDSVTKVDGTTVTTTTSMVGGVDVLKDNTIMLKTDITDISGIVMGKGIWSLVDKASTCTWKLIHSLNYNTVTSLTGVTYSPSTEKFTLASNTIGAITYIKGNRIIYSPATVGVGECSAGIYELTDSTAHIWRRIGASTDITSIKCYGRASVIVAEGLLHSNKTFKFNGGFGSVVKAFYNFVDGGLGDTLTTGTDSEVQNTDTTFGGTYSTTFIVPKVYSIGKVVSGVNLWSHFFFTSPSTTAITYPFTATWTQPALGQRVLYMTGKEVVLLQKTAVNTYNKVTMNILRPGDVNPGAYTNFTSFANSTQAVLVCCLFWNASTVASEADMARTFKCHVSGAVAYYTKDYLGTTISTAAAANSLTRKYGRGACGKSRFLGWKGGSSGYPTFAANTSSNGALEEAGYTILHLPSGTYSITGVISSIPQGVVNICIFDETTGGFKVIASSALSAASEWDTALASYRAAVSMVFSLTKDSAVIICSQTTLLPSNTTYKAFKYDYNGTGSDTSTLADKLLAERGAITIEKVDEAPFSLDTSEDLQVAPDAMLDGYEQGVISAIYDREVRYRTGEPTANSGADKLPSYTYPTIGMDYRSGPNNIRRFKTSGDLNRATTGTKNFSSTEIDIPITEPLPTPYVLQDSRLYTVRPVNTMERTERIFGYLFIDTPGVYGFTVKGWLHTFFLGITVDTTVAGTVKTYMPSTDPNKLRAFTVDTSTDGGDDDSNSVRSLAKQGSVGTPDIKSFGVFGAYNTEFNNSLVSNKITLRKGVYPFMFDKTFATNRTQGADTNDAYLKWTHPTRGLEYIPASRFAHLIADWETLKGKVTATPTWLPLPVGYTNGDFTKPAAGVFPNHGYGVL